MADKRIFNIQTEATIDDITEKVYAWFDKKAQQGEVQEPSWKFDVYLLVKILNNFATKFVPNVATVEGKCYWHGGELFVCDTAYTGDWVPGNFTLTSIDEIFARKDVLSALQTDVTALTTYAQNVAHSIAPPFDSTRTDENPYKTNDVVTYIDGKTYIFKEPHYGPWTGTDVDAVNLEASFSVIFDLNPEYKFLVVDHDGYMLFGVREDGNFVYGKSSQIDGTIVNKIATAITQWYDRNFIDESNPQYKCLVVDHDGYMLYGVDAEGNFIYGKSLQVVTTAKKEVSKIKSNILAHKVYNSASVEDTISLASLVGDYMWVSILAGNYYTTSATCTLTIIGGDNNGRIVNITANRPPQKISLGIGCTGVRVSFNAAEQTKLVVNAWNYYDDVEKVLKVSRSASDTNAHFICDGENDEEELFEATATLGDVGTVRLGAGTYYVDDLPERFSGEYGAVIVGYTTSYRKNRIHLEGLHKSLEFGTQIYVRDSAFENVPEGTEAWIFGARERKNAGVLFFKDIAISIQSNAHKVVCINGQYLGGLVVDNCRLAAGDNAWSDVAPTEGSVGIRGVMGDCNGTEYEIKDTYCVALYEGFQLGGEHLVMTECGTRFCYYGYSFGNYDYGSWYEDNPVTCSHPLTLINCCDEGSRALPLFAKCGVHSATGAIALQAVNMINFNLEVHTALLEGAEEVTPGSFCGIIDFVSYGVSNSSKNTAPSALRGNRVDTKFWKDGSGENFTTVNDTHKLVGSTTEREGYWAQLGQKFFDTTLNKFVFCIDSENQTWVDCNGTSV